MKPDTIMIDEYIPVIKLIEFMGWKATLEPMQDHLRCCNKQGDRFLNY